MGNELQVIVDESGLDKTKAEIILSKFQNYFELSADWERKAKTIVVTDESQTDDMKMARTGRLLLREKRIEIEKARKELKEQALREGKAIDGIANVLKALIVPIEEYLEKQEKFVEFRYEEKKRQLMIEAEKKMEEDRIAKEKADAEERERIRLENDRLKKEAEEMEKNVAAERKEQERKFAEERAAPQAELAEVAKKAAEEKARQEVALAKERAKVEAEKKAAEANAAKEREAARSKAEAERKEKERLQEILKNTIECPHCHKTFLLGGSK